MLKITEWALKLNSNVESALDKISGKADGASRKFTQLQSNLSTLESKGSLLGSAFSGAIAGLGATVGLGMITKSIYDATAASESFQISMETMLKSKEKADMLIADIVKFAATTPYELSEVQAATRSLIAFGISATDVKSELTNIGNIASGINAPIGEIAELYGKAKVQGRLFAEDINQLTGRGIPIIQELSKQFGVTDSQVKKLVETGKVGFVNIQQAFADMAGSSGQFNNLMEKQSHSLSGMYSNMMDKLDQLFVTMGQKLAPTMKSFFSNVESGFTWMIKNWSMIEDVLVSVGVAIATTASALLLYKVYAVGATIAQLGLNAAMAANPIGAITIVVMGLVTGIVLLWQRSEQFRGFLYALWDTVKFVFSKIANLISEVFGGMNEMISGIINLDLDQITGGISRLFNSVTGTAGKFGTEFGNAWSDGMLKGITEVKAGKLSIGTSTTADMFSGKGSVSGRPMYGAENELKKGESSMTEGSKQVRNVTVNINKLVEKIENHFATPRDISNGDLEKKITDVIIRAMNGAEISMGNG